MFNLDMYNYYVLELPALRLFFYKELPKTSACCWHVHPGCSKQLAASSKALPLILPAYTRREMHFTHEIIYYAWPKYA